jgi:hypothetical protein
MRPLMRGSVVSCTLIFSVAGRYRNSALCPMSRALVDALYPARNFRFGLPHMFSWLQLSVCVMIARGAAAVTKLDAHA